MDLNALKSQLDTTESQLSQYTANLPSEIETQIQNAYTPALEKSLGTTKDMMSDYLGRYFDTTTMGPGMAGTTALDLSPTQKLGVMGRELGTMSGELQATQKFSDYLGGQMNDMYQKALQAAQMGQQNLADQYGRQMQLYQMAWQEAEAEKDRAASLAAARAAASGYGYGTGGGITGLGGGGDEQDDDITIEDKSWTRKVGDVVDKNSALTGYDFTSASSTPKQALTAAVINPAASITKTLGSAIGNLAGNWRNKDMNFWEKLYNIR